MKLIEFLNLAKNKEFWINKKVICFKCEYYPFLFFNKLFDFLNKKHILPASYKSLIYDQIDKHKIWENLSQSFLGQQSFYWLGRLHIKTNDKKKTEFLKILLNYSGPNFVAFCINSKFSSSGFLLNLKNIVFVDLDEKIRINTFNNLKIFFNLEFSYKKKVLIKKFLQKNIFNSIDQICLLFDYLDLVKVDEQQELEDYLLNIIPDQKPTLSLLVQYFFEYKPKLFFKILSMIENDYSEMFWIYFWSEHVYRAYFVSKFLKQNKLMQARSLSFRLPYSFVKRYWKNISLNGLLDYSNFLYNIDFSIKNGSKFCSLDLFYFNHFVARKEK